MSTRSGLWVFAAIPAFVAPLTSGSPLLVEFVDEDGDGVISRSEFVRQANQHLDQIIRRNSDGYLVVDPVMIELDMLAYIKSLFGDVDGDGEVTLMDVVAIAANAGAASGSLPGPLQGDLNQDGVVDASDVLAAYSVLGSTVPFTQEDAWFLWNQIVFEGVAAGYDPSIDEILIDPLRGMAGGHRGANDHNQQITGTWPPPPAQIPATEWNWPSDHLGTVSQSWGNRPGQSTWPANHFGSVSATWENATNREDYWPPNHDVTRSGLWNTDGLHQSLTSRQWPADHLRERSIAGQDSDQHVQVISNVNQGHNTDTSELAGWPPNHIAPVSRTWTPDHERDRSGMWPANHLMTISQSWTNPNSGWPANHYEVISVTWSQPGDHSTRVSILFHPANPFRLPDLFRQSATPDDMINLLGFEPR